jgi:hypothetical protein
MTLEVKPSTHAQALPAPEPGAAESLDDLAREATAEAPDPQPIEGETIAQPMQPNDGLRFGCGALVKILGGLVCGRAGVSPLSDHEVSAVGDALAGVAVYYLPTDGDPRFMAWATLALALGSVAAPRVREAREGGENAAASGNP